MHRIMPLLFLVFYFASTCAISQERVRLIVGEIQQSASGDAGVQLDDGRNQIRNGFPSFRQAKPKAASDVYFGPSESIHLLPHKSDGAFHTQASSLKSLHSIERLLSRAPPASS